MDNVFCESCQENFTEKIKELKSDILILVGRLYGENPDTFAPETYAVMEKWRSEFEKFLI